MERASPNLGGRLTIGVISFLAGYCVTRVLAAKSPNASLTKSPREAVAKLPEAQRAALPYPPDLLPGGREVVTPYGSIQVYEWGEELGEKILLLPGISTPVLALSNLAEEFVGRGFRVMMFGTTVIYSLSHRCENAVVDFGSWNQISLVAAGQTTRTMSSTIVACM
jgi:hypothetical protein